MCTDCATNLAREGHETCPDCCDKRAVWQDERDRSRKARIVEYMGGECTDCRLRTDALEVYEMHHLDPSKKDYNIGSLRVESWERIAAELAKCVMLCSNCHRIRHRKLTEERLSRIRERLFTKEPTP